MLIPRPIVIAQIVRLLAIHPLVALLGPRQYGKTTMARMIGEQQSAVYFDLENPVDARRLAAPLTVLEALTGLVVIDAALAVGAERRSRRPGARPQPSPTALVALASANSTLSRA